MLNKIKNKKHIEHKGKMPIFIFDYDGCIVDDYRENVSIYDNYAKEIFGEDGFKEIKTLFNIVPKDEEKSYYFRQMYISEMFNLDNKDGRKKKFLEQLKERKEKGEMKEEEYNQLNKLFTECKKDNPNNLNKIIINKDNIKNFFKTFDTIIDEFTSNKQYKNIKYFKNEIEKPYEDYKKYITEKKDETLTREDINGFFEKCFFNIFPLYSYNKEIPLCEDFKNNYKQIFQSGAPTFILSLKDKETIVNELKFRKFDSQDEDNRKISEFFLKSKDLVRGTVQKSTKRDSDIGINVLLTSDIVTNTICNKAEEKYFNCLTNNSSRKDINIAREHLHTIKKIKEILQKEKDCDNRINIINRKENEDLKNKYINTIKDYCEVFVFGDKQELVAGNDLFASMSILNKGIKTYLINVNKDKQKTNDNIFLKQSNKEKNDNEIDPNIIKFFTKEQQDNIKQEKIETEKQNKIKKYAEEFKKNIEVINGYENEKLNFIKSNSMSLSK